MNMTFEVIMRRISPTLTKITHRLNGHFAYFDDDDLFQEALGYLWLSFQKGILNDKTDSYILQGCYFHLKNYIRTHLDRAQLTSISQAIDENGKTLEEVLAIEDDDIRDSADEALLAEAERLLNLTERERKVLALSCDGMTLREIGERLGISHVMVQKIRKRVRIKCAALKRGFGS